MLWFSRIHHDLRFYLVILHSLLAIYVSAQKAVECSVKRKTIDKAAFEKFHREKEIPVIVSNASDGWQAHTAWSQDEFVQRYGGIKVNVKSPDPKDKGVYNMTVADFLASPRIDLIAFEFSNWAMWSALHQDISPPSHIFGSIFEEFTFTLGRNGTGSKMHAHAEGWITQIRGVKVWLLAPPDVAPSIQHPCSLLPAQGTSSVQSDSQLIPKKLQACRVSPGESIYVPAGWHHGTCNQDQFTIGLGGRGQSSTTPLHWACYYCDLLKLQNVAQDNKTLVQLLDGRGEQLLHASVKSGCMSTASYLLEARASVAARIQGGLGKDWQPMHLAIYSGHVTMVELLANHGASISAPVPGGSNEPPIFAAVERGHVEVLKTLVNLRANVATRRSADGDRPIHEAANFGHAAMVEALSSLGASIKVKNRQGMRPVHVACSVGHAAVALSLASLGASIVTVDNNGAQPIHSAAEGGHVSLVQLLASRRAGLEAMHGRIRSPMHHAVSGGHVAVVTQLAMLRASIALSDQQGLQPLHIAALFGHRATAELLIKRQASVSASTGDGVQPLHVAAGQGGHVVVAELLAKYGASTTALDKQGWQPVHHAEQNGHARMTQLLKKLQKNSRGKREL